MLNDFSAAIAKKYLNKFVEIYQGDDEDTRYQAELSSTTKSIIYGKIVEVDGQAVMVEIYHDNKKHIIMINAWSIKTICESSRFISLYDAYKADIDLSNMRKKGKI